MHLTTDRLVIRPWRPAEAPRLFAILSDPDITRWLGTPDVQTEVSQASDAIDKWAAMTPPRGVWAMALADGTPDGSLPLGSIMLVGIPDPGPDDGALTQIGWYLHPDSTGHGYVTEAAAAVLEFGLASGFDEIRALTHLDNHPSIAVAARLGMTDLGETDRWYGEPSRHFLVRVDPGPESGSAQG